MKGRIRIDTQLCKGCRYCIITCPRGVIALDGDFNRSGFYPAVPVQMDRCSGCALCAEICPEIAIEIWRTKELKASRRPAPKALLKRKPPARAATGRR